jgi:hypothetical protein
VLALAEKRVARRKRAGPGVLDCTSKLQHQIISEGASGWTVRNLWSRHGDDGRIKLVLLAAWCLNDGCRLCDEAKAMNLVMVTNES